MKEREKPNLDHNKRLPRNKEEDAQRMKKKQEEEELIRKKKKQKHKRGERERGFILKNKLVREL